MIFYSSFNLLMILMILAILKDLMIVDTAPTSMLKIWSAIIPAQAETTIIKSNTFQPSLK